MYLRSVLHPPNDELLNKGVHVWASLSLRQNSEKKEKKESEFVFFGWTWSEIGMARCFPAWRAAFSILELRQGLMTMMSSKSTLFLRRGWLTKSTPAPVVTSIDIDNS